MVKVTETELEEEFEVFSIHIDSSDIIDKLQSFCHLYRLSAEKIVEEWVAFCSTKKLNSKKLDTDALEHLERERLVKKDRPAKVMKNVSQLPQMSLYNMNDLEQSNDSDEADDDPLLNLYSTPNNKSVLKKRQRTPENSSNKRPSGISQSPASLILKSPAGQGSPLTASCLTPSQRYTSRGNAGEVVCSFGESNDAFPGTDERRFPTVGFFDRESSLHMQYKYMFQKISEKAFVLNDLIVEMGEKLKQSGLTEDFVHLALPAQETVTVVGRVCCDSNGKLNASSLLLEGAKDTSGGRQVALDVSNVPVYSLFPGQIIAVDGTNNSGKKLIAGKIHEGVALQSSPLPNNNVKFSMLIAAGPYTTTDNILYEPLNDLISYLQKGTPPDVCILMGPFVDAKHPLLEKGDIGLTYEELFADVIMRIVRVTSRLKIQLVIVPSTRDLHHDYVYPQPPFLLKHIKECNSEFVHLVSDPCTLDIDGITIALTSTDILFHLGAEEISSGQMSDRIMRLVQHILNQHTYYPLYPPHIDVPIDLDHFDMHCHLPVNPNLLILPSDLRCYVKEVGETVSVNPGRMAKGQVGGTFTRLNVNYQRSDQRTDRNFINCVTAEIVRI